MITSSKHYIPVVTFSINDNIKLLQNLRQEVKGTISWNKCRPEVTTQSKDNNSD